MKNTTKVTLLSTFAFPGAGHLFLKYTKRGIIFLVLFCALMFPVIDYTYHQTLTFLEQIIAGTIQPTLPAIQHFLANNKSDSEVISIATYAMLVLWFISILDSYRLAKAEK